MDVVKHWMTGMKAADIHMLGKKRRQEVARLHARGLTVSELARRYDVSRTRIYQILKRHHSRR